MLKARLFEVISHIPGYRLLRNYRDRVLFCRPNKQEAARLNFYARFIKPGDLVYDVGANLGNRSKVFLALGAEVVAFEPQPFCADYLANVFRGEPGIRFVRKALGAKVGKAKMYISNAHTISSLSPEWIDATRKSGRFSAFTWNGTEMVDLTTLDHAIATHGLPSFIKIDVEGYEHDVLSGLSTPVDYLSFEFTYKFLANTYRCIDHIESLAPDAHFQYSIGESMEFALDDWVDADRMRMIMGEFNRDKAGDIYVRYLRGQ